MKKVYVDDSNKASIICPKCLFEKNIDVTKIEDIQKELKCRCRCGEAYQFIIEYRKKYRKDVRLPGEYIIQKSGKKGEIIIRSISMIGIQFECLDRHQILKDDTLEVKFKLDDPNRSEIRKSVKVIWFKDRNIGANFIETQLYKKDLGFYLMVIG